MVHPPQSLLKVRWLTVLILAATSGVQAAGSVTGVVFRDYDANGLQTGLEPGVANIGVQLFDASGACSPVALSNSSGAYTADGTTCSGSDWRMEFSAVPSYLQPGVRVGATAAGTTTSFVAPGDVANLF